MNEVFSEPSSESWVGQATHGQFSVGSCLEEEGHRAEATTGQELFSAK